MKYIVEDWDTCKTIAAFDTEEDRRKWLDENCSEEGFLSDGTKISIYEERKKEVL